MEIFFLEAIFVDTTIGDRIRQIRTEHGLTMQKFAAMIGISAPAVSQYENNQTGVKMDRVIAIAEAFGVSKSWLLTGEGDAGVNEPYASYGFVGEETELEYADIPFVPIPARATFIEMASDPTSYGAMETYRVFNPPTVVRKRQAVVLEINGDSMEPQLRHGAKVLALEIPKGDWTYQTGRVYAVAFDNQFVIKRISDNGLMLQNTLKLVSDNPKGGSLTISGDQIRGMWRVIRVVDAEVE